MTREPEAPLPGYVVYDPIDPFENGAGPFFWRRDEGGDHFVFRAEPGHCNTFGVVHGGLLMTLADLTMAATSKERREDAYITVSFNGEFVAPGLEGMLIESRGELVKRTASMAFVRGRIEADGNTLFVYSGVMKRLRR